ncbi:MAG: biotin/lipoyl-binding protein, partial [Pseudoxanthomonas sp.]
MSLRSRSPLARRALALPALAALALALALAGCSGHAESQAAAPPPQVGVVTVQPRPVQAWDEFPGRIEAIDRVELRPRVSGYIEQVRYREGQDVRKGEVLFTIDPRSYRAALAAAQAQLARARSQAAQARSEAA